MSVTEQKVLLAGGDVGGARAALAVAGRLLERGTPFLIALHGALAAEAPSGWARIDIPTDGSRTEAERLLEQAGIGLLLFTTSVADAFPLRLARAARSLGLPVICLLDSWMNYRTRLEGDREGLFLPDVYAVMDETARAGALAEGLPVDIVEITGQPALASLRQDYIAWGERSQSPRLPGAGSGGKMPIAFFSEPVETDHGGDPRSPTYRGYTEKTVLRGLCRRLQDLAGSVCLILAAHPRESREGLRRTWEESRGALEGDFRPGREALFAGKAATGMTTLLLYEAQLLGKPALSLQPGLRRPDLAKFFDSRGIPCLRSEEDWTMVTETLNGAAEEGSEVMIPEELEFHRAAPERICRIVDRLLASVKAAGSSAEERKVRR